VVCEPALGQNSSTQVYLDAQSCLF
jgi:hypothetical protein